MTTQQTSHSGTSVVRSDGLLRKVLKLDAVATGAVGALLLVASSALDDLLGLPATFLVPVGLFLVVYAVAIMLVANRPSLNRTLAWGAAVVNSVWVVDSLSLIVLGWFPLTALGTVFVIFQGAVVALFAVAQVYALRRSA